MTRADVAQAAREGRLCAAVLAAPSVDGEVSAVAYALTVVLIECALGHAHRVQSARERSGAK